MEDDEFETQSGTIQKGKDYEVFCVANFIVNMLTCKDIKDFRLASNAKHFGKFDDVIIEAQSNSQLEKYAIQLKHSNYNKTLAKESLFGEDGKLNLKKYCDSYGKDIKDDSYKTVLYTNLKFDGLPKVEEKYNLDNINIKIVKCQPSSLLNTAGSDSHCFKFEAEEGHSSSETYNQFFKNFSLYTKQANYDKMKNSASETFQKFFNCNNDYFEKFLTFVDWWCQQTGKKKKLGRNWITRAIAVRMLSPYVQPIASIPGNSKYKLLKEAISQFHVTICSEEVEDQVGKIWGECQIDPVDCKKINQIRTQYQLNFNYVTKVDDLKDEEKTLLLWLMNVCPLIVKENPTTLRVIELCPSEKFVLLRKDPNCEEIKSVPTFQQLSNLESKSEIYQKITEEFCCSLQGKEINLKSLIEQHEEFQSLVSTSELVQMLDKPLLIGEDNEQLPDPHIDRKLTSTIIDFSFLSQVAEEDKNVLIVISCMNKLDVVEKHLNNFNVIKVEEYLSASSGTSKKLKEKSIFLSDGECSQKDFDEICNRNSKNMKEYHHFSITEDGRLEWIKTRGSIENLEAFRSDDHFVEESKLYNSNPGNNINVICANAGMGKSTMTKSLRNKLSSKFWTIIMHPADISQYFRKENTDFERYIEEKLQRRYRHFDFEVLQVFKKERLVAYIWDGMDEISDENFKSVMEIIKKLAKEGFLQLITSRCHLAETLEKKFKVFSRTITQFDSLQQDTYIEERLKNVCGGSVQEIRRKIKENIEMIHCKEILGIPLQIYMLTELFCQNPQKYSELLNNIFSLTDLYHHFVNEKFNYYYKNKAELRDINNCLSQILEGYKKSYLKKYEKSALKAIFEQNHYDMFGVNCEEFLQEIKTGCDGFGFITEVSDNLVPTFLHNSYGEYFVASYFFKNYKKIPNLKAILFRNRYTNVRFLFDLLMAKDCPAHIAVLYRNFEVLTKHENSLNSTDKGGRNPLQVACTWGQTYPLLNTRLCDEDETYSIDDKLGDSVGQENEIYQKIIGYLLEKCDHKKKDELFQIDSLAYADLTLCLFPLIQLSKLEDLNFDSFQNFKDICSVLFYALKFDHAHVVDLIKDVPLIKTERRSLSLLHLCSNYNSRQFLSKLLSIDKYQQVINSEDIYNVTATSIACRKGRDEMLKILIDAGADITNSSQLIEIACKNGHHKVVELLLKSLSNLKSGSLSGSLQTACLNGFDKIVHLLVDRGANVDASNRHGTPLYIACQYGHEKTVEILLKSQADVNKSNKFGSTPLHIACQTKRTNIVKLLLACTTTKINSVEKKGFAPLHAACKNGCEDIVELLIAAEVDVNLRGTKDVTPLWNACRFGYDRVVKRLVDAGADVNVVGHNGYSLLHLACQENHKNVVDLLVKAGVKVNEVNNEDMTPLQIAQEKGFQEIVEVLELRGSERI
ncbi:uncharacterized protein [Tenebrio molitor]|uniref:uncharacterized protein n=1 Tax=Tenebrio molitor TaxID=7067 RepID=UPI003624A9D8